MGNCWENIWELLKGKNKGTTNRCVPTQGQTAGTGSIMVTESRWSGEKWVFLYSLLTSLSVWDSSGISSSWISGRLQRDYKWLQKEWMAAKRQIGATKNSNCHKETEWLTTNKEKTCKYDKNTNMKRQMLPWASLFFFFFSLNQKTGHCAPAAIAPDPFLCSHGNSWPPGRCRHDSRHLAVQQWQAWGLLPPRCIWRFLYKSSADTVPNQQGSAPSVGSSE